jgi:hypothetical protein
MKKCILGLVFQLPFLLFAQWEVNNLINTPVCVEFGKQNDVRILGDDEHGAFLAWKDARNGNSNPDIYVQHVDLWGQCFGKTMVNRYVQIRLIKVHQTCAQTAMADLSLLGQTAEMGENVMFTLNVFPMMELYYGPMMGSMWQESPSVSTMRKLHQMTMEGLSLFGSNMIRWRKFGI